MARTEKARAASRLARLKRATSKLFTSPRSGDMVGVERGQMAKRILARRREYGKGYGTGGNKNLWAVKSAQAGIFFTYGRSPAARLVDRKMRNYQRSPAYRAEHPGKR